MARSKDTMSVLTQIFASIALVSVLWIAFGYTLTFDGDTALNPIINGRRWCSCPASTWTAS